MALTQSLEACAQRAHALGCQWRGTLSEQDQRFMVKAFHRAESLAKVALCQALEQVSEQYQPSLLAQLADEERHVDVFANWRDEAEEEVLSPRLKERTEPVWFALLLVNEVAGFCQFHMLHGLLGEGAYADAVAEVAHDEIEHIERLSRWLEPWREAPAFADIERIVRRFRRDLDGRMKQFLPRDEFEEFRAELATAIEQLLLVAFGMSGERYSEGSRQTE